MNVEKICTAYNITLDSNNYLTDRTVYKTCFKLKRRENINNALIKNQQPKINNDKNNKTLIIGF